MYIKLDENGTPIADTQQVKPDWIDAETGEPLTDVQLIERERLYPVYYNPPAIDEFYQELRLTPENQWIVKENCVVATYEILNIALEEIIDRLKDELSALRYLYETKGFTFTDEKGVALKIDSSRESHTKIMGARQGAQEGLREENALWKTIEGFVSVSNTDIIRLGSALLDFTQACYNREAAIENLIGAVDQGNYLNAVDILRYIATVEFTSGWPQNALFRGKAA